MRDPRSPYRERADVRYLEPLTKIRHRPSFKIAHRFARGVGHGHVFVCRRTYCFLPPTPKTTGLSPGRQLKANERTRFSLWLKWSAFIKTGLSPLVCPDATRDPLRNTNTFNGVESPSGSATHPPTFTSRSLILLNPFTLPFICSE